jgi:hypothetical protein
METTLTKRVLAGCVVKASVETRLARNAYLLTIKIEKAGHNLLIGGSVNINISGLDAVDCDYININNDSQPIIDVFNQQRLFYVDDASTLTCKVDINSSSFSNAETVVGGTPVVKINNDKITLKEGSYNFELINKVDYPYLRVWDNGYRFALKEIGIGSKLIYNGAVDIYSDGNISDIKDINEQDLTFAYCQSAELYIVDNADLPIGVNDYTKTTNIGIIINKI